MAESGGSDDPAAFEYNLPLTAIFGDHPKTEVLAAMLTGDDDPPTAFSANELSRIAGLEEATVREHVEDLLEVGIVVEADEMAEGTYELDAGSDVVADVRQLTTTSPNSSSRPTGSERRSGEPGARDDLPRSTGSDPSGEVVEPGVRRRPR